MKRVHAIALALALASAAFVNLGCPTTWGLPQPDAPVHKRGDDIKTTNRHLHTTLAELEKGVSRADERAQGADTRAGAAAREAARANEQAAIGIKDAAAARAIGEKGVARAGEVERNLGTLGAKVENLDNYKQIASETVLFDLGSATLKDEAKQQLDALASRVASMKRYTVEVQGFTDSTGDPETNIRLSQRRADAVVRYLTLQGKLPLYRVMTVGYGEDNPASDNKTRDGRKQNRRVEVRVYASEAGS